MLLREVNDDPDAAVHANAQAILAKAGGETNSDSNEVNEIETDGTRDEVSGNHLMNLNQPTALWLLQQQVLAQITSFLEAGTRSSLPQCDNRFRNLLTSGISFVRWASC